MDNRETNNHPDYSALERMLQQVFSVGEQFEYRNQLFTIENSGKPLPDCKTDLYIMAIDSAGKENEFKLSIKKDNHDFLGNKLPLERAIEIFGPAASEIITRATLDLKKEFDRTKLIFPCDVKENNFNITLGWRFDLLNKGTRRLSCDLDLNKEQMIEVLNGNSRPAKKKNAKVNGITIIDSGVPNLIVEYSSDLTFLRSQSIDYFVSLWEFIPDYVDRVGLHVIAGFSAVNFRSNENKWDENRALAVWIEWTSTDGGLSFRLIYDDPLETRANVVGEHVRSLVIDSEDRTSPKDLTQSNPDFIRIEDLLELIQDKNVICNCGCKEARSCACNR